ncbi:polyphosphate polymerase domain-containing protein [Candidatus Arthromitus sp. SFB-rat-Yit]|uniref:polyphosphate polymerase domain-containing protein n=1 Tax=Candidatus Arthromitus sp. SFB-rat-Yit TaxID=1041504 RepID=UPI000227A368|nr:polyphosphate polymerase domain-containing protein [Candidatus Arthromitus sp. SFB-rat-Yit]BAK80861.1 hypothetical protein RATSFB_0299 [Candidatus Arthromitus sp. SFB-rat-Yit]
MKTFMRYEKKYMLTEEKYLRLMDVFKDKMEDDIFPRSSICNIYFDTSNFQLIRNSLDKPVYKEKLRMRSYGVPNKNSFVFVELKKKYDGVVYKRREKMHICDAENYLYFNNYPKNDTQVIREIDWMMNHYKNVIPSMYISYDRIAMRGIYDNDLRITFDKNILYRDYNLDLKSGIWGDRVIREDEYLMEIKISGGMPFWLCRILTDLSIYPTSFSKYGVAYQINKGYRECICKDLSCGSREFAC